MREGRGPLVASTSPSQTEMRGSAAAQIEAMPRNGVSIRSLKLLDFSLSHSCEALGPFVSGAQAAAVAGFSVIDHHPAKPTLEPLGAGGWWQASSGSPAWMQSETMLQGRVVRVVTGYLREKVLDGMVPSCTQPNSSELPCWSLPPKLRLCC